MFLVMTQGLDKMGDSFRVLEGTLDARVVQCELKVSELDLDRVEPEHATLAVERSRFRLLHR